jgi:NTE family protein
VTEGRASSAPRPRVGLALGGGGARGVAHLGALEVIEEAGLRPCVLAGTSIGSIAAALYALEPDAKALTRKMLDYLHRIGFEAYGKDIAVADSPGALGRLLLRAKRAAALGTLSFAAGLVNPRRLIDAIEGIVPDRRFDEAVIPLRVTAFDVLAARTVILDSGRIRDAVVASSNLAGFFPPYRIGERLYCDASPVVSVPVTAAREAGAEKVVAVDIRAEIPPAASAPTGIDVVMRVTAASSDVASAAEIARADVVIRPDVGGRFWSDFAGMESMVELGRRAAREKLAQVLALTGPPPA